MCDGLAVSSPFQVASLHVTAAAAASVARQKRLPQLNGMPFPTAIVLYLKPQTHHNGYCFNLFMLDSRSLRT